LAGVAFAQTAGVRSEIFGVRLGDKIEDVRKRLDPLGETGGSKTRDGGKKEAWVLKDVDYTSITLRSNAKGEVVWIGGFLRPGKEIPFSQLGDISKAVKTDSDATWTIDSPNGKYQIVGKGDNQMARAVYLIRVRPEKDKD
jgi:hypothetical protein